MSLLRRSPILTVQVDVDSIKHLLQFYGHDVSRELCEGNAVYRKALPRFAKLFGDLDIRATFFVVGGDLEEEANQEVVRQLHGLGHEIANHTFTHPFNLVRMTLLKKRDEINRAGDAIEELTGQKPVGFRAPGYEFDQELLKLLIENGYLYDSSVMPSALNLPFKWIQMMKSKRRSSSGYGDLRVTLASNRPYCPDLKYFWRAASDNRGPIWEIPVSCVPYVRLPFYANFNLLTGGTLFRLCSAIASGMDCNYVFHAVELLDPREIDPRILCHPNACIPLERKTFLCKQFLQRLRKGRRVLSTREFVGELRANYQSEGNS